jgi:uncharacterized cupredoxin-like copper-binding protein
VRDRVPTPFAVLVPLAACAGLAPVLLGSLTAPAAGRDRAAGATVVAVTAGKPSEFAFKLSKSSALPWQAKSRSARVTFRVRNEGALRHSFKVCTKPVKTATLNACTGTGTRALAPGQSATLTVTFRARGTYEYLSGVAGQAARGMKGLIGIGVPVPKPTPATTGKTPTPAPTPATPPTTTTAPPTAAPPTTAPAGDAAAGAAVWLSAGCSGCHTAAEVRSGVGPNLNLIHPGPFANGPLTPAQISDLVAYLNSSTG